MSESNETTHTVVVRNSLGQATDVPSAAGWSITDHGSLEVYGTKGKSLASFAEDAWASVAIKPGTAEVSR